MPTRPERRRPSGGMELAVGQGLDVRVVTLPPGQDPADAADEFEGLAGGAESYVAYRVRLELERAPDRQSAHELRSFLDGVLVARTPGGGGTRTIGSG